jgi:hypothetical protein
VGKQKGLQWQDEDLGTLPIFCAQFSGIEPVHIVVQPSLPPTHGTLFILQNLNCALSKHYPHPTPPPVPGNQHSTVSVNLTTLGRWKEIFK